MKNCQHLNKNEILVLKKKRENINRKGKLFTYSSAESIYELNYQGAFVCRALHLNNFTMLFNYTVLILKKDKKNARRLKKTFKRKRI